VIWVFVAVTVVIVFAIAAVTVGRETFRLGHTAPSSIFDIDEAVLYVADDLPPDAQARLTHHEVRVLITVQLEHLQERGLVGMPGEEPEASQGDGSENELPLVLADDDAVALVLGRTEAEGLDVADHDAFLVVSSLHRYLAEIGALGPRAG
jgi:hypothetical protein